MAEGVDSIAIACNRFSNVAWMVLPSVCARDVNAPWPLECGQRFIYRQEDGYFKRGDGGGQKLLRAVQQGS